MTDRPKTERLKVVLRDLNISLKRAVDFLHEKEIKIESNPNAKITHEQKMLLIDEFQSNKQEKNVAEKIHIEKEKQLIVAQSSKPEKKKQDPAQSERIVAKANKLEGPKSFGKIDLSGLDKKKAPKKETPKQALEQEQEEPAPKKAKLAPFDEEKKLDSHKEASLELLEPQKQEEQPSSQEKESSEAKQAKSPLIKPLHIQTKTIDIGGINKTGDKIDLTKFTTHKNKRERIKKEVYKDPKPRVVEKKSPTFSEKDVDKQLRQTLERITSKSSKNKGAKFRKEKRILRKERITQSRLEEKNKVLKVAEFITVNELASMMDLSAVEIIKACMDLGIMATLNQRLDAETLVLVADEFGYDVKFMGSDLNDLFEEEEDAPEDLSPRAPIVTVMGHVDHGKTSLLDYIRKTNVIAGESGGITQHIAAYSVLFKDEASITFLDTPGHEAFTAMRARGAQITDIAIIVIAADDQIMPQTREAISHAKAAGVPMIFAINKIDKPGAQPEKVREQLAAMDLLVEEWGGKYQSQEISAKSGLGVDKLLEKITLEAELLELRANYNKPASGTVIEASLDKGRGYVSTLLVSGGTLKVGDYLLAGTFHGKIKSILDERGKSEKEVMPSKPALVLGLNGAPSAGDKFRVFLDEKEAKQIATKRDQLQREQTIRTKKHLSLDEIGRRIALGNFKELKIILKADVDGSVEALSDAIQGLSSQEIMVSVIHKAVGQIIESDVMLATASDAIIIGFNVRPAAGAKALAEKEKIDIQTYSVIYDAIDDIKEALEGMRTPEKKEQILGSAEVREVFKISKVGSIAGCFVIEGKLIRNAKVRVIREGVVIYNSALSSLKRFKEDAKEVSKNYECGLMVKNYNDIQAQDIIEAYEEVEV